MSYKGMYVILNIVIVFIVIIPIILVLMTHGGIVALVLGVADAYHLKEIIKDES
jgi:hypothetical protein